MTEQKVTNTGDDSPGDWVWWIETLEQEELDKQFAEQQRAMEREYKLAKLQDKYLREAFDD